VEEVCLSLQACGAIALAALRAVQSWRRQPVGWARCTVQVLRRWYDLPSALEWNLPYSSTFCACVCVAMCCWVTRPGFSRRSPGARSFRYSDGIKQYWLRDWRCDPDTTIAKISPANVVLQIPACHFCTLLLDCLVASWPDDGRAGTTDKLKYELYLSQGNQQHLTPLVPPLWCLPRVTGHKKQGASGLLNPV
jgi:hypothetical protein